jgi:hypothetical protein
MAKKDKSKKKQEKKSTEAPKTRKLWNGEQYVEVKIK